jgi:hypothetical protein
MGVTLGLSQRDGHIHGKDGSVPLEMFHWEYQGDGMILLR